MNNVSCIQKVVMTDKAALLREEGKYVFLVEDGSTKNEIKKAVKDLYGVDVAGISTIRRKPKPSRFKAVRGTRGGYKKAVVTLKEGQVIKEFAS